MNNSRSSHEQIGRLTALALLTALVIVLQTLASAIRIGPVTISLTLAPIVLGAILYGPLAGVYLGGVFGAVVLIVGLTGTDQFTFTLLSAAPFWTVVVCMAKSCLAGLCSGLLYRAICRKNPRKTLGCACAALAAPIVNTGVFALGMATVLRPSLEAFAGGTDALFFLFTVIIGVNFVVELFINAILITAIARVVQIVSKK